MGAMRSASEQQLLARDCFGGSVPAVRSDPVCALGQPSMECLMTLLWATDVIHRDWLRNQSSLAKEGANKDIRQTSLEQEDLFRLGTVEISKSIGNISLVGGDVAGDAAQKGFERGWSRAFKHS